MKKRDRITLEQQKKARSLLISSILTPSLSKRSDIKHESSPVPPLLSLQAYQCLTKTTENFYTHVFEALRALDYNKQPYVKSAKDLKLVAEEAVWSKKSSLENRLPWKTWVAIANLGKVASIAGNIPWAQLSHLSWVWFLYRSISPF